MSQATKYEILYIIRPDLTDDSKKELVERFDSILTENGTEVVESKDWAKKRFVAENAQGINEFDRLAKINRDILRHMIVKVEA